MLSAQQALHEQLELPAGYSITWAGQYEYMERAKAKLLRIAINLAIIVCRYTSILEALLRWQ